MSSKAALDEGRDRFEKALTHLKDQLKRIRTGRASSALVEGFEGNLLVPVTEDLSWNTNFTYMLENHNKQTGQPLSVIPEYTINSSLKWRATEALVLIGSVTYYGEQEPRTVQTSGAASTDDQLKTRDAYAIFGVSGTYDINDNVAVTAGVTWRASVLPWFAIVSDAWKIGSRVAFAIIDPDQRSNGSSSGS